MVLYVMKWDIHPDKIETYLDWTKSAIKKELSVPGVVEFRAYRPASGNSQVVCTYEFNDMDAWSVWLNHEDIQKLMDELHTLALNVKKEIWGPSPVVPIPIRPGN